ncbi:MAG: mechanosensitive ion channel domain-containing protein [bacterium]
MQTERNKRYLIGILAAVSFLLLMSRATPLLANSLTETEIQKLQQETAAMEETIRTLSDERQREDLIYYLEALLTAKKEALTQSMKDTPARPKRRDRNLIRWYQRSIQKAGILIHDLKKELSQIPTEYDQIKYFLSNMENRAMLLDAGLKFLISLLLSALLWIFIRKLVRKWKIHYLEGKTATFGGRMKTLLFHVFLASYSLAIVFFFSVLFLKLVLQNGKVTAFTYTLGAWLIYRIAKSLCSFTFSPANPQDRLFRIDDQLAYYILVWCHRLLLFSFWMFILIKLSSLSGLFHFSTIFSGIYRVGLLIMMAIILAQWKESIQKRFSLTIKGEEPPWKLRAKKVYNHLIGKIYLAIIIYFSVIVLIYLLGYKETYRFILYSTLQSFLALALIALLWFLWNLAFQKLFSISEELKQRYPVLEARVNQYVTWIDKLARFFLILFAPFLILSRWNLDTFGFLQSYSPFISRLIRIPLIVLIAILLIQIINLLIQKTVTRIVESRVQIETVPAYEVEKQMNTIGGILQKSLSIAIVLITGAMILTELGFSIGPLLAGAGIVGVAVGFGSQYLVRDIISGLFMIVENQVRVGDVAILNGTGGLVEQVNLRTTVLRGLDGTVHVFPNGSINTVSNMTHDFSYYVFDVGVAYREDVDQVCAALTEIGDQITREEPYKSAILEPLEILGLDKFADSAVIIKARIKTKPIKQWLVGREMNRRIKKRFDELGIEIPFPHCTFYFGEGSKPVDLALKGSEKIAHDLKDVIRSTVKEIIEGKENKG